MAEPLKLLNFTLADEQYLLPIDIIGEILRYQPVTKVPTVPDVVHGVINLRGSYVPVIDLARRLALGEKLDVTARSCIVITRCSDDDQEVTVGLLIDEVNEFISIARDEIKEPPRFGHAIAADMILGLAQISGIDHLVLNVAKLLDLRALVDMLESVKEETPPDAEGVHALEEAVE